MANLLAALNSSPIASALSGTQRMSVGGGSRVPKFGPTVNLASTKSPTPGGKSPKGKAPSGIANMLSRPKRNRRSGYSKTAPAASPVAAGGSGLGGMPMGGGPSMSPM